MKRFLTLVIACALSAAARNAAADGIAHLIVGGPVHFNITASYQNLVGDIIHRGTNSTLTTTNIHEVSKDSISNSVVNETTLLKMLENSFKTNFAKGARLVADGNLNFYIADKTGTNILLDVSSVFSPTNQYAVTANTESTVDTITTKTNTVTGSDSETTTQFVTFIYDDTALVTADGLNSQFQMNLTIVVHEVVNITRRRAAGSFSATVVGSGTVHGKAAILEGTATGTVINKQVPS